MPRKKFGPYGWLANIHSDESFGMGLNHDLSPDEKVELRKLFDGPLFQKALANARLMKPTAFAPGLEGQYGAQIASNRLHEMRGWKLFEVALAKQAIAIPKRREMPKDNFPDEGRTEAEFKSK